MSIKISPDTITILENFASINKGVFLRPGNELRTISSGMTTAAVAKIKEDLPHEVPIHDIMNFLNALKLFNDPTIELFENERHMTITEDDGKASVMFLYSAAELVKRPKDGRPRIQGTTINFSLTETQNANLVKATSVFKKPEWAVISDGKNIKVTTFNSKEPHSSNYSIQVDGEANGVKCNMVFSFENIRLLTGNYNVVVTESMAQFTNSDVAALGGELEYWIGIEATSKWNQSGKTAGK